MYFYSLGRIKVLWHCQLSPLEVFISSPHHSTPPQPTSTSSLSPHCPFSPTCQLLSLNRKNLSMCKCVNTSIQANTQSPKNTHLQLNTDIVVQLLRRFLGEGQMNQQNCQYCIYALFVFACMRTTQMSVYIQDF